MQPLSSSGMGQEIEPSVLGSAEKIMDPIPVEIRHGRADVVAFDILLVETTSILNVHVGAAPG